MNIRKINLRYSKWAIILAFITLPYFLLFTFMYLPFGEMVTYSFYKMKYIGEQTFVGPNNYKDLFTRDSIFNSLKLSLYYMGGAVVQLVLALLLATLCGKSSILAQNSGINNVSLVGTSVRRYLGQD